MELNHELRFGMHMNPDVPWDDLLRKCLHIEELGFDITGTSDTFVNWFNPSQPCFELWALTSAWAAKTHRIRLGYNVSAFPFRNPAFLAKQALTVDHISNGRLELGLAAGTRADRSYEMTGIPNWSPGQRVARFREYVEIVDQLLRNEVTTYEGRYYTIKGAVMSPRPVQTPRPPITIAAQRPRMLKLAVQYADTWTTIVSRERLEVPRQRNALVDTYCKELDRDPRSLRRSFWLGDDTEILRTNGLFGYYESEDAFKETFKPFIDMGMTEILLSYPCREEQFPVLETIARDVIPELKEKYNT